MRKILPDSGLSDWVKGDVTETGNTGRRAGLGVKFEDAEFNIPQVQFWS